MDLIESISKPFLVKMSLFAIFSVTRAVPVFKILKIEDLEATSWNIILLFGGAMSLGYCLVQTGAADWMEKLGNALNWLLLLLVVVLVLKIIGLYFFGSVQLFFIGLLDMERGMRAEQDKQTALTALHRPNELEIHIGRGLDNGLSREEICELIMHMAIYGGFPVAVEGMAIANRVFEERSDD